MLSDLGFCESLQNPPAKLTSLTPINHHTSTGVRADFYKIISFVQGVLCQRRCGRQDKSKTFLCEFKQQQQQQQKGITYKWHLLRQRLFTFYNLFLRVHSLVNVNPQGERGHLHPKERGHCEKASRHLDLGLRDSGIKRKQTSVVWGSLLWQPSRLAHHPI